MVWGEQRRTVTKKLPALYTKWETPSTAMKRRREGNPMFWSVSMVRPLRMMKICVSSQRFFFFNTVVSAWFVFWSCLSLHVCVQAFHGALFPLLISANFLGPVAKNFARRLVCPDIASITYPPTGPFICTSIHLLKPANTCARGNQSPAWQCNPAVGWWGTQRCRACCKPITLTGGNIKNRCQSNCLWDLPSDGVYGARQSSLQEFPQTEDYMFRTHTWEDFSFIPTFSSLSWRSSEFEGWLMNRSQLREKRLLPKSFYIHLSPGWWWGRLPPQIVSHCFYQIIIHVRPVNYFYFFYLFHCRLVESSIIISSIKKHTGRQSLNVSVLHTK